MAIFALPAGSTYYAAIWGFDGTRWNGSAMVAPSAIANIDWETGMVPLVSLSTSSSSATGMFTFTAPATLPAGFYFLTIHTANTFESAVNALATMKLAWNGSAEVQELPAAAAGASGGVSLVGSAVTLTSAERVTLAAGIEAALVNDGDATAFLQAIADRFNSEFNMSDLTPAIFAAACRDAILNRVLSGNHDTTGTTGKLLQDAASVKVVTDKLGSMIEVIP